MPGYLHLATVSGHHPNLIWYFTVVIPTAPNGLSERRKCSRRFPEGYLIRIFQIGYLLQYPFEECATQYVSRSKARHFGSFRPHLTALESRMQPASLLFSNLGLETLGAALDVNDPASDTCQTRPVSFLDQNLDHQPTQETSALLAASASVTAPDSIHGQATPTLSSTLLSGTTNPLDIQ